MTDQGSEVAQVVYSSGWVGESDIGYVVGGNVLPPNVQRSMRVADVQTAREVDDEADRLESAVEARALRAKVSGQVKRGLGEVFTAAGRRAAIADARDASIARNDEAAREGYGPLTPEQKVADLMHEGHLARNRKMQGSAKASVNWGPMHAGTALRAADRAKGR